MLNCRRSCWPCSERRKLQRSWQRFSMRCFPFAIELGMARGVADCGCLGGSVSPPTRGHSLLCFLFALCCLAVAVNGVDSFSEVISSQPMLGIPYLLALGSALRLPPCASRRHCDRTRGVGWALVWPSGVAGARALPISWFASQHGRWGVADLGKIRSGGIRNGGCASGPRSPSADRLCRHLWQEPLLDGLHGVLLHHHRGGTLALQARSPVAGGKLTARSFVVASTVLPRLQRTVRNLWMRRPWPVWGRVLRNLLRLRQRRLQQLEVRMQQVPVRRAQPDIPLSRPNCVSCRPRVRPPWLFDPSCGTTSRTDENTRNHTRPCAESSFGAVDVVEASGTELIVQGWAFNQDDWTLNQPWFAVHSMGRSGLMRTLTRSGRTSERCTQRSVRPTVSRFGSTSPPSGNTPSVYMRSIEAQVEGAFLHLKFEVPDLACRSERVDRLWRGGSAMTILVVTALVVAVALLAVLVVGLLRSHAEILRALQELGS